MASSNPFYFKKFKVYDDKSTMRVNTDGVLLGALVTPSNDKNILEIGCGAGYISMMLAQKNPYSLIHAIDIDSDTVAQANYNFRLCKWANRLAAYNIALEDYSNISHQKYNLIVSNPPFHLEGMKSINTKKSLAKHTNIEGINNFFAAISNLLVKSGELWIIISAKSYKTIISIAREHYLFPNKQINIKSIKTKSNSKVVVSFRKQITYPFDNLKLVITNENQIYTDEFIELMKDYLLLKK